MESKAFIYGLYSTDNPEEIRYVGKTIRPLRERLHNHIYESKTGKSHKSNWIRLVNSKNLEIKIVIIDIVWKHDWEFWEIFWIAEYKRRGYKLTNTSPGGGINTESPNSRGVVVLDLNGKYKDVYESISSCSTALNIDRRRIEDCLRPANRKKSFHGNQFIYKELYDVTKDYNLIKQPKKYKKISREERLTSWRKNSLKGALTVSKPIGAFDNDGNLIHSFPSLSSIGRMSTEFKVSGVTKTLYGNRHTHKGFIWRYL